MAKLRSVLIVVLCIAASPLLAHAQFVSFNDYCSGIAPKASAGVDISSATDTQLVPLVSNQAIYVCDCNVNQAGGVGTVYLESATAASCGGTLAQLSAKFTANTTAGTTTDFHLAAGAGATSLVVPSGKALCVKSTGTIVQSITCSYVQK